MDLKPVGKLPYIKRGEAGLSLVEMAVAAGFAAVVGLGVTKISDVTNKSIRVLDFATELTHLKFQAARLGESRAALNRSAAGSPALAACLAGACPLNRTTPYVLRGTTGPFAGTAANPIRYNRKGVKCNAGDAECQFEATAEFRAACMEGSGCGAPEVILSTIRFRSTRLNRQVAQVIAAVILRKEGNLGIASVYCGLNEFNYPRMVNAFSGGAMRCNLDIKRIDGDRGPQGFQGAGGPQGFQGPPGPPGPPPPG